MKRASLYLLLPLVVAVLLLNIPSGTVLVERVDVLVIYGLLTALALYFGVLLDDRTQLSSAHGMGMLAFLSLPATAFPALVWALAGGALLAEIVSMLRTTVTVSRVIFTLARMVLPFYVAGWLYQQIGVLPAADISLSLNLPVIAYAAVYITLYAAIFVMELWYEGVPILRLRDNLLEILIVLGLPLPFALLGADVYNHNSRVLFATFLAGFTALLISPHAITSAQRRLRTQLERYRQLSDSNQSLYDAQRERVAQLATLNNVLLQLNGTLSFEVVLETVIASAQTLSGGAGVALYMYWDDVKGSLALVRSAGMSSKFTADPPDPLVNRTLHRQPTHILPPLVIADAARDADAEPLRDLMRVEGKPAWIELPLTVGGVTIGVLVIYFGAPHVFADESIEVLRMFANQVAQALSNARLYAITDEALERRVGQLLALAAIGHELTATIDLKTIGNLVLSHALDATSSRIGALLLLDEHGEVEFSVTRGYAPGTFDQPSQLLNGIAGEVIKRREPILIDDRDADPRYARFALAARSQLTVPILHNADLLGVITLENPLPAAFGEEDINFILQLTNQAVIAIDNARLFIRTDEARDRLQLILNTIQEAIILIDGDGVITLANPRVDLIGLKPAQVLGKNIKTLAAESAGFAPALGFTATELATLLERAAGVWNPADDLTGYSLEARYLERQTIPIADSDSSLIGVLLVFYDETERIRLAQTRDDVSRMLIHDLRSPLTAVTTSLKLLSELTPKDSQLRPLVESTSESGRRAIRKMLQRVDSLLDVSRMETGFLTLDTEPAALTTIIQTAQDEIAPIAQEIAVTIQTDLPENFPRLNIDADKVERVVLNLLDNALKFTPENGTVTIRARNAGGMAQIDVIDQGPGVPEEYKARLFDRFVQVKEQKGKRRGSGLGLTFCRLVVENHGGKIWVGDNPDGGSVFSFTLPVVKEKEKEKT